MYLKITVVLLCQLLWQTNLKAQDNESSTVIGLTAGPIFSDETNGYGFKFISEFYIQAKFGISISTQNTFFKDNGIEQVQGNTELLLNWGAFVGIVVRPLLKKNFSMAVHVEPGFLVNTAQTYVEQNNSYFTRITSKNMNKTKFAIRGGASVRFNITKKFGLNLDIDALHAGVTEFKNGYEEEIYGVMFGGGLFLSL